MDNIKGTKEKAVEINTGGNGECQLAGHRPYMRPTAIIDWLLQKTLLPHRNQMSEQNIL